MLSMAVGRWHNSRLQTWLGKNGRRQHGVKLPIPAPVPLPCSVAQTRRNTFYLQSVVIIVFEGTPLPLTV
jgi:hypothetical protein